MCKFCYQGDMMGFGGGAVEASRARARVCGPNLRFILNFDSTRCFSKGEKKGLQQICPVCDDVWQRDMGHAGGGYAEGREDDHQDSLRDEWFSSNTPQKLF